jgi:(p)ppGpp synthase/HD superfamily hydrolase
MTNQYFQDMYTSMSDWIIHASESNIGYLHAHTALKYAGNIHTGMRKDNETPEFQHQLEIAHFIRSLHQYLVDIPNTLAVIFLHDCLEDYAKTHDISVMSLTLRFNAKIAQSVHTLSKIRDGVKISNEEYYAGIALCPISSICKGADRINNLMTMHPVFSYNKQRAYIQETQDFVLPMIESAIIAFPTQENIYNNIKLFINTIIRLTEQRLDLEFKHMQQNLVNA